MSATSNVPLFLGSVDDLSDTEVNSRENTPESMNNEDIVFLDDDDDKMVDLQPTPKNIVSQKGSKRRAHVTHDKISKLDTSHKILTQIRQEISILVGDSTDDDEPNGPRRKRPRASEPEQENENEDYVEADHFTPSTSEAHYNPTIVSPEGILKNTIPDPTTNERGEKTKWEIRRQFVFLTYPRCNMSVNQFIEEFRRLNHYPDRYIACRESHKLKQGETSAGHHFHVSTPAVPKTPTPRPTRKTGPDGHEQDEERPPQKDQLPHRMGHQN